VLSRIQTANHSLSELHNAALEIWTEILNRCGPLSDHDRDGALNALERWFETHFLRDWRCGIQEASIESVHTVIQLSVILTRTEARSLEMV